MNKKSVLITGGSGSIGIAVCSKFLAEKWTVFLADVDLPVISEISHTLGKNSSENCTPVEYNPCNAKETICKAFGDISKAGYSLDVLVCAHCTMGEKIPATKLHLDKWEELLQKNVFGCYLPARYAAKAMIADGKPGHIIFIGDTCYKRAIPGQCAYTSSMGALRSLTRGLAIDFASHGISVNCIMAGPLSKPSIGSQTCSIPTGLPSTPEQIANAVWFLTSQENNNMTGSAITIDGGLDCLIPGVY